MNLHHNREDFSELISLTSQQIHIPENAVERDYFIVRSLQFLAESKYAEKCVFKGGTSLSKCYPGSIERFSEDIDLSFVPEDGMTDKQIEKQLNAIEKVMIADCHSEIIPEERNERNKSICFWYGNKDNRVKLEIGSSVKPEPYVKKTMKSYIHEYLEMNGFEDVIEEYELASVTVNTLCIERTFVDKLMSVKRHAICGSLSKKSRHIYDVVQLFQMEEIQAFLADKERLKYIVGLTKDTDSYYLNKRSVPEFYVPTGAFNFSGWKTEFVSVEKPYERLHEDLLFTNEKQRLPIAFETFEKIDSILKEIGE